MCIKHSVYLIRALPIKYLIIPHPSASDAVKILHYTYIVAIHVSMFVLHLYMLTILCERSIRVFKMYTLFLKVIIYLYM